MKTNDIKKGMRILLKNGWYATMMDNMRGNIRMAKVEGFVTEIGSVYAHDISMVELKNGDWVEVEHTKNQSNLNAMVDSMFG